MRMRPGTVLERQMQCAPGCPRHWHCHRCKGRRSSAKGRGKCGYCIKPKRCCCVCVRVRRHHGEASRRGGRCPLLLYHQRTCVDRWVGVVLLLWAMAWGWPALWLAPGHNTTSQRGYCPFSTVDQPTACWVAGLHAPRSKRPQRHRWSGEWRALAWRFMRGRCASSPQSHARPSRCCGRAGGAASVAVG